MKTLLIIPTVVVVVALFAAALWRITRQDYLIAETRRPDTNMTEYLDYRQTWSDTNYWLEGIHIYACPDGQFQVLSDNRVWGIYPKLDEALIQQHRWAQACVDMAMSSVNTTVTRSLVKPCGELVK